MKLLMAWGADARLEGAVAAARQAGWEAMLCRDGTQTALPERADAVLLPWPVSFRDGLLAGTSLSREETLARLPPCSAVLHGAGVEAGAFPGAASVVNPSSDERFVQRNAQLTAEGALCRAMQRPGRALLGSTCMVTGFGRIAQALTVRLIALGAFVIACARSEVQMQQAHALGAHPMPLDRVAAAAAQADVIFNTVPARVLTGETLARLRRDALIIELASAPYGADAQEAERLGVEIALESGLPGRYAPLDAGAALFEAAQRAVTAQALAAMEGGKSDE